LRGEKNTSLIVERETSRKKIQKLLKKRGDGKKGTKAIPGRETTPGQEGPKKYLWRRRAEKGGRGEGRRTAARGTKSGKKKPF